MAVMEHGALKILCVSVDLGMRKDRCYVLVSFYSHSDETFFNLDVCYFYAACQAGEYRSSGDTTCQQCPDNTVVTERAAAVCQCLTGYYRNDENHVTAQGAQPYLSQPDEQPSDPCTSKLKQIIFPSLDS